MTEQQLRDIIAGGENQTVEFKRASKRIPKSLYETVCSFLNRRGGHILLGVEDNGRVSGIADGVAEDMKVSFASSVNNPEQLEPRCFIQLREYTVKNKTILHAYVPESSQVHRHRGKVFDRNSDGDFDVTGNHDLVRQLHVRKQGNFSETTIYPGIRQQDLRQDLLQRARLLARNRSPSHPWTELDDEALLRSAGLWRRDYRTGEEGFTMAAALLLGTDELIHGLLPYYKTDAIVRRLNRDRYDDRLMVRTNLLEAYDYLMDFVAKHLPDRFYLEGDLRVNLRDRIFREIIANTLIHREYRNEYPAKLIIEPHRVLVENWNRPHGGGPLRVESFTPFPKNPVIAGFFREIGRADELGSGLRNTSKFLERYAEGGIPAFIEGDVFRVVIPVRDESGGATPSTVGANAGVDGANVGVDGAFAEFDGVNGVVDGDEPGKSDKIVEGVIRELLGERLRKTRRDVRSRMEVILKAIYNQPGRKATDYHRVADVGGIRSVERYLQQLKDVELVEFRGEATKTGGYFPTQFLIDEIEAELFADPS